MSRRLMPRHVFGRERVGKRLPPGAAAGARRSFGGACVNPPYAQRMRPPCSSRSSGTEMSKQPLPPDAGRRDGALVRAPEVFLSSGRCFEPPLTLLPTRARRGIAHPARRKGCYEKVPVRACAQLGAPVGRIVEHSERDRERQAQPCRAGMRAKQCGGSRIEPVPCCRLVSESLSGEVVNSRRPPARCRHQVVVAPRQAQAPAHGAVEAPAPGAMSYSQ